MNISHCSFSTKHFQTAHAHTPSLLTGVVFAADTGVPSLSAGTHPSVQTGVGVAQVDLCLTVITRESHWAAAA